MKQQKNNNKNNKCIHNSKKIKQQTQTNKQNEKKIENGIFFFVVQFVDLWKIMEYMLLSTVVVVKDYRVLL